MRLKRPIKPAIPSADVSLKVFGGVSVTIRTGAKQPAARMVRTALQGFLVAFTMMLLVPTFVGWSTADAATVSRIEVRGAERVDAETVKAYLLIQPGQNFSAADVDELLKALFETGLFADASVVQSGGTLVVTVQENPIINTVAFEGNKKFKDNQLEPAIQSKPRGVFTRAKVQNDVQRILELYRRSGRFQASVEPKVIELPSNRVNLVFEVAEGPNTGIASINFIGNQAYGDRRLRNVISTQESGFLSFLRAGDNYDPDRLAADEEKLRRFYLDHGYADFQVVSSVADLDRERNSFFITFSVMENQNYRFGAIAVDSTIPGVDAASLQRLATTDEGDTFSSSKVDESMEAMTLELAGAGYAFAQVRPRFDRNPETLTIGVTYIVDEGTRTYIERIEVRGNSRTRDYVIRREFDIAEGDAFNRVLVDRAERRLNSLGYFQGSASPPSPALRRTGWLWWSMSRSSRPASSPSAPAIRPLTASSATCRSRSGTSSAAATPCGRRSAVAAIRGPTSSASPIRISSAAASRPAFNVYRRTYNESNLPVVRFRDDRRRHHVRPADHRGLHRSARLPAGASETSRSTTTSATTMTAIPNDGTTSRAPSARPRATPSSRRSSTR